jgi:cyclohexyl-isocyanide hydratase
MSPTATLRCCAGASGTTALDFARPASDGEPMSSPLPISVAFLIYPDFTQLDATGPAQFLSRLGEAKVDYVARTAEPVMTDAGFAIVPTATFADVARADIICVPGGLSCVDAMEDEETLDWVRSVGADAQWVTSVCTGSLILAAAGLLKGYRAASHWAWREHLALFGAEPVAERVVFDRNRVTGGGVTAGIDFALALTAAVRGEPHARVVQLALEYDPAPPFNSGSPDRAGEALVAIYHKRVEALAPGREDRIRAVAEAHGFGG